MSRTHKLTRAQQEELLSRYILFLENRPGKLAIDFGICLSTVNAYIRKAVKEAKCSSP